VSSIRDGGLIINAMMATRNPTNIVRPLTNCTEFQVHASQQAIFEGLKGIIDFTEQRLRRCIALAGSEAKKASLATLLRDYKRGVVAISWRNGEPAFIYMTKER
jgi:hypothetical protein